METPYSICPPEINIFSLKALSFHSRGVETSARLFIYCVMRSRTGTSALSVLSVRLRAAKFSFLQTGNPIFFL